MLRFRLPPWARRVPSWAGVLLACALSVLLLAAVHCSSALSNDGHGHLSLSLSPSPSESAESAESAGYEEPPHDAPSPGRSQHEHGSACSAPCLTTWVSGAVQRPAETDATPVPREPGAVHPTPATAVVSDSARSPIARTGRSALACTCRWRI
ncbi:hypothetical protein ABZY57_18515 [Streptomyces sp. NPDC006450]|uniref:hypothetical protein n=1 Tax=Streptomyces sp. NPDC006450 TaxID=3155458 RepID=UPI0033B342B5